VGKGRWKGVDGGRGVSEGGRGKGSEGERGESEAGQGLVFRLSYGIGLSV
jgi:hypothetical protein